MATKRTRTPAAFARKIEALEASTKQNLAGSATVVVTGIPMTSAQILARLGTLDRFYPEVSAARAAVTAALAAYDAALPGMKLFIANFEAALKAHFGVDSPKLRAFGICPAGARLSPREAILRSRKAVLTRQSREQSKSGPAAAPRTLSEAVLSVAGPPSIPAPLSPTTGHSSQPPGSA